MADTGVTDSMQVLFDRLEKMLQAKTVFGEPIAVGDVTLIPVVDITFGAGSGGGTGTEKGQQSTSAGGGAGARVSATAVIVVRDSQVQVMKLKKAAPLDRLLELVPEVLAGLRKDKPAGDREPDR